MQATLDAREPNDQARPAGSESGPDVAADRGSLFGYMKSSLRIEDDVKESLGTEWSALSGEEDRLYRAPLLERPRNKK